MGHIEKGMPVFSIGGNMENEPNEMQAQEAQLQMTITITRKETGAVEEYILTGTAEMPTEKEAN